MRQYWTHSLSTPRNPFFAWLLEPHMAPAVHGLCVSGARGRSPQNSPASDLGYNVNPCRAVKRMEQRPGQTRWSHPRDGPAPVFSQDVLSSQR